MGGEIIYKEESYILTSCAFAVFNDMGYGHHERIYGQGYAIELTEKSIPYKKELYMPVLHKGVHVSKYYLDFLVWNKIVVELKVGNEFHTNHVKQVLTYLRQTNTKLGIIYLFTPNGVEFKRIVM